MNIGDVPGLIGIRKYFNNQIHDAEQARIQKWQNMKQKQQKQQRQKSLPKLASISDFDGSDDNKLIEEKKDDNKYNDDGDDDEEEEINILEQIPTYFDLIWLDAMIENAKGCVEKAIKLYFMFIEAHIIQSQTYIVEMDDKLPVIADNINIEDQQQSLPTDNNEEIMEEQKTKKDEDKINDDNDANDDDHDNDENKRNKEEDKMTKSESPTPKKPEKKEDEEHIEEFTFFTETFLNRIAHLGLKCCIDAGDWLSCDALYQLLTKKFENKLDRLSEIRGYNVNYIESLSGFDAENIRKASESLSSWELNLGVNPLKSATIPTTTRCDLFKTADMYHLQGLLLSLTSNEETNNSTQNNKNASNAKLATKFCKEIFRDPLRVVSHSNYNDQYSMLLRITCSRAVELTDLNVLNSFVHSIYFDENDILNQTPSQNNNEYLLISTQTHQVMDNQQLIKNVHHHHYHLLLQYVMIINIKKLEKVKESHLVNF